MAMESAFAKFQALATASLDDCGVWEKAYGRGLTTVNNDVSGRFGTEEVSQRVADYVTSGGTVSDSIGAVNNMAKKLVDNCFYSERSVSDVLGGFNQNIIDSVELYKNASIKTVPIFNGKLSAYMSVASQKMGSGIGEAYNGLMNKLGVVAHEVPNYISDKATAVSGGDDASLILGLTVGGVVGLCAYVGKKMGNSGLFYNGK